MHKLPRKESETVEFKTSFSDEVIETLVAFANNKGGAIFIGMNDKGTVQGCDIGRETVAQWLNEIKSKTYPHCVPDIETVDAGRRTLCIFRIKEYPIKPVAFKVSPIMSPVMSPIMSPTPAKIVP